MAWQPKGTSKPMWNRDEEEYKDLNIIEDMVRGYSQMLIGGQDFNGNQLGTNQWINTLKGYYGALNNYLKWIAPYLKTKFNKAEEVLRIEILFDLAKEFMDKGKRKKEFMVFPKEFNISFEMLQSAENRLKELKVKHNMGVRVDFTPDSDELEMRRLSGL